MNELSEKTRLLLWTVARGLCSFDGCKKDLLVEDAGNRSLIGQIAHIEARSKKGPRASSKSAKDEANTLDNLILLCPIHHKLIDDHPVEYPAERIRQMKLAHERWVSDYYGILSTDDSWTIIIQDNPCFASIPKEDALKTIHESKIIATSIKQLHNNVTNPDNIDWPGVKSKQEQWWDEISKDASITQRFCILSLTHIPFIVHLGHLVRASRPVKVFQYNRLSNDWTWELAEDSKSRTDSDDNILKFSNTEASTDSGPVVICISISYRVALLQHAGIVPGAIGEADIYLEQPSVTWLVSENQIEAFKRKYLELLAKIKESFPNATGYHIFAAVPASIAFIIGALVNHSVHPPLHVYNFNNNQQPQYTHAFELK